MINWLLHIRPAFWLFEKEYYFSDFRFQNGVCVTVINDNKTYTSWEIGQILGGN